jgi:hypothetical protein
MSKPGRKNSCHYGGNSGFSFLTELAQAADAATVVGNSTCTLSQE